MTKSIDVLINNRKYVKKIPRVKFSSTNKMFKCLKCLTAWILLYIYIYDFVIDEIIEKIIVVIIVYYL